MDENKYILSSYGRLRLLTLSQPTDPSLANNVDGYHKKSNTNIFLTIFQYNSTLVGLRECTAFSHWLTLTAMQPPNPT